MAKDKAAPPEMDDLEDAANDSDAATGYSICILRHGIAGERDAEKYPDDDARPLTAKGRRRMRQIAEGLHRIGFGVDWVVTSPLVRAAETAEIIAASLPFKVPLDTCAALAPGGSVKELAAFLAGHAERKRIVLVGHEPDLSALADRMIGASRATGLSFKKGGCCLIQSDDAPLASGGTLLWWLTPRLLRILARGA